VLEKIDPAHPSQTYIATYQTLAMVLSPWASYVLFERQLFEYLKLQLPSDAQPGAFAFGRQGKQPKGGTGGAQKAHRFTNACQSCDLHWCTAGAKLAECSGCNESVKLPEKISVRAKKFYKIYHQYRKEKKLSSMKGVTIPKDFVATSQTPSDNPGEDKTVAALAEELDEDFWQSLHTGTSSSIFALGMVEEETEFVPPPELDESPAIVELQ